MRDIKELIGIFMRVAADAEVTEAEVQDLDFDADGDLLIAVNAAYIGLLEFAYDRELRALDRDLDHRQRLALQQSLNDIVRLYNSEDGRG